MLKVELNKKTNNPFYGLKNCLELYQSASKGVVNNAMLNRCWEEVKDNKEHKEMFFSLLFSVGDITARQHNIFKKQKIDSGGSAQREAFRIIMDWLRMAYYPQYRKFLFANLFNEYTSFDMLLQNRVKTVRNKKKVESTISSLTGSKEYLNDLSDFVVKIIQGTNPSHKHFLAKFLTRPRLSKRQKHKTMLPETREMMKAKQDFLLMVSEKANLPFVRKTTHIEFTGYIAWRKEYLGDLESVMFSSGKIKEFDKDQFKEWLNKIPSSARYRVRCRVLDKNDKKKDKWGDIGNWYLEWEKFKDAKQTEVRQLEEKIRQGSGTEDDEAKLKQVKKEAKVTVGAVNFEKMFTEIVTGTIDKVKVQPFLDKVNLAYNTLVFVDDSGSMNGTRANGVTAFDFATFMATICLVKNPDEIGRSLIGFYSKEARLYTNIDEVANKQNSILNAKSMKTSQPLIDGKLHFLENLQRIRQFAASKRTGNGTNISAIPDYLYNQLKNDSTMLEQLQSFPVWTIISDGNFNNMGSAEASINDFMRRCEGYFGFRPFVIAIDVASNSSALVSKFSGIDNFMFVPPNPAQVEQILTNFKDMDIMDVYTPLQGIHRSNRYELVRKATI